jgi:hypothetical protein
MKGIMLSSVYMKFSDLCPERIIPEFPHQSKLSSFSIRDTMLYISNMKVKARKTKRIYKGYRLDERIIEEVAKIARANRVHNTWVVENILAASLGLWEMPQILIEESKTPIDNAKQ